MLSLGCPKNLVDGEVMLGRLQGAGYRLVADAKQADVVVVNTCAFIDRAKQESVDAILEMAQQKESGRAKRLVVTGCLTQRYDARAAPGDPGDRRHARDRPGGGDRAGRGWGGHLAGGGGAGPAHLGLRPHRPACPLDAAVARLPEDQRGLRLHLLLLHHPDAARPAPQPRGRGHRGRGEGSRGPGRARGGAGGAGLDALRPRPRGARRARLPAAPARAGGRPALDPRDVRLPVHPHGPDPRRDGRRRRRSSSTWTSRCSTRARRCSSA